MKLTITNTNSWWWQSY